MSPDVYLWFMAQRGCEPTLHFVSDTIFPWHTYGIQATIGHAHSRRLGKGLYKSIVQVNCKGRREALGGRNRVHGMR